MADLTTLAKALGFVAPWYNLALVTIVVLLFLKLFDIRNKKVYTKPWKMVFVGVLIFIVEEVMTVLRSLGLISFHPAIFPMFEVVIISLFIYALLLQKQYVSTGKRE